MSATDQQQLPRLGRLLSGKSLQIAKNLRRCRLDALVGGFQTASEVRLQRPQINTVRVLSQGLYR
ncbi:hypothetical protein D3C84_922190 [compost metagenome]